MKKIAICLLLILLLAGTALAQTVPQKPPKAKTGRYGTPGTYTGQRMNAIINRARSGKKGAAIPSAQMQRQSIPYPYASLESLTGSAPGRSPALHPAGDRPFDAGTHAVNPFALPDASPGSLWSPPVSLESAANPFKPAASTVNPFQGTRSNAVPFAPKAPGFSVPVAQNNPAASMNGVPSTRTPLNSPDALPSPWSKYGDGNAPFLSSPIGSPWDSYPKGSQGNPYSLENLFPGSSPRMQ